MEQSQTTSLCGDIARPQPVGRVMSKRLTRLKHGPRLVHFGSTRLGVDAG